LLWIATLKKLGIFVGEDNWSFFDEIYQDLAANYKVEVFKKRTFNTPLLHGRLNRWAFQYGIQSILNRNDVCFFEWASDLLAFASYMPKRSRIVTRLHSFELYEWAPKINWDAVDKIILLSKSISQLFVEMFPDQRNKIIVINNGISLEKFKCLSNRQFTFTIGMLGHIAPIKRVYEAILAIFKLTKQGYPVQLRIAGNPDHDYRYTVAVNRLVEKLDLIRCVYFDGFVKDPLSWLQQIDIFLSNSYWEGQQTALLEAMASGCYCLSHAWAGSEEVLPESNIFITEDDFVEKASKYFRLPDHEKRVAQAAMRSIAVEKFDVENTKREIKQVIDKLSTIISYSPLKR
jgi:glycosyltransferase involved in cell wall biosynthesis